MTGISQNSLDGLEGFDRFESPSARSKPVVVFVDDEQRVLNSMRALFRRDYEVHLTTQGAEAIALCERHDADVIVADQRMPGMTGVEVLGAVRERAPRTVRILLTGYADLDAIEGSINIGEVFRFLSKPCPTQSLKATLKLAVEAAGASVVIEAPVSAPRESAPAPISAVPATPVAKVSDKAPRLVAASPPPAARAPAAPPSKESEPEAEPEGEQVVLSGEAPVVRRRPESFRDMESVGIVVFTVSDAFFASVAEGLCGHYQLHPAHTLSSVLKILEEQKAGVLISDISSEGAILRRVLNKLKEHVPTLMAIVVSDDRDAAEMISLINHGQIFRYMSKPMSAERLLQNVNGGALRHLQLKANPTLIPRNRVEAVVETESSGGGLGKMFERIRTLGGLWNKKTK